MFRDIYKFFATILKIEAKTDSWAFQLALELNKVYINNVIMLLCGDM
jgi:hypothetical protein